MRKIIDWGKEQLRIETNLWNRDLALRVTEYSHDLVAASG
jgi:hypothetical protein